MSAKIFLTINAVVAILYGLGFLLVPASTLAVYGVAPDPHVILTTQFFGSALLGIGVVFWFAKDFRDWDAIRGVLIANVIAEIVGGLVNLRGTYQGLLNAMAWSSTIVYVLLLAGSLYCLSMGPSKQA